MTKSRSNALTLFLALVGCALATLLTVEHYTHMDIGCAKTGGGCGTTLNSAFGQVTAYGIAIPTAAFGLGMYAVIAALCLLRGKQLRSERDRESARAAAYAVSGTDPADENAASHDIPSAVLSSAAAPVPGISVRHLDRALWGIALLGFGISIWLQYVSIYQLLSFCPYCFTSATLVTIIFILTSRDHLLDGRKLTSEQKMLGGVLGFIMVMGSFIVVPQILDIIKHPPYTPPPSGPVDNSLRDVVMKPLRHTKGDPKAKFTIVEFADYMCTHCAKAAPVLEEILNQHSKELKIGFRNFPLPIATHKWARKAAVATEAAAAQGKYWEMHDLLFLSQAEMETPSFTDADFDRYASQLKLDVKKFDRDRVSADNENYVKADFQAGELANVGSTPTFFFASPTKFIRFVGIEDMKKFANDPKNWK